MTDGHADVIVVGGGIAGLAAASFAAGAGREVLLLERSKTLGGLARTTERDGFRLNLGPRALYPPAARLLDELGVPYPHGRPPLTGYALAGGRLHPMPDGVAALLGSPLFDRASADRARRALAALLAADARAIAHVSLAAWLDEYGVEGRARQFVEAVVRLAGYIDAPDVLSAAAAQAQLMESAEGVRYVDGGWQTIVDGLARVAETRGVRVRYGARVTHVVRDQSGVTGVALLDGEVLRAPAVVLAVRATAAREVLAVGGARLAETTPVRAAVLDVALSRLPHPAGGFIVALDRPLYLSVHSLAARLAPDGGAVAHVARYLAPDEHPDPQDVRDELAWLLDRVQPGWRDAVVFQRFLPDMTVTDALPTATGGGLAGRPAVRVDGVPGAYLAGDWVGDEYQLAGAALASAKRAAALAAGRQAMMLAAAEV